MHFPKLKCEIFVTFSLLVLKCRDYLEWVQKAYLMLFDLLIQFINLLNLLLCLGVYMCVCVFLCYRIERHIVLLVFLFVISL